MDPYISQIIFWACPRIPVGWAICDGRSLPITQYQALYSLIGVTYGGDGITNFRLPDLRGRVPVGAGTPPVPLSAYALGATGGVEQVTLQATQMPAHNHAVNVGETTTDTDPNGKFIAPVQKQAGSPPQYYPAFAAAATAGKALAPGSLANSGGGGNHENRQPYLALNYIIALEGIYPTFD